MLRKLLAPCLPLPERIRAPGATGHDLGTGDLLNHKAVSRHQPQWRFELGDPADRDQLDPPRAILPQRGIKNDAAFAIGVFL